MPLEKIQKQDRIEITDTGVVFVRVATYIAEDGQVLSSSFERRSICPGDDVSGESDLVAGICRLVHTDEVVQSYKKMIEEQEAQQRKIEEELASANEQPKE